MTSVHPTMLWESTDAHVALQQRFRFDSSEHAARWLMQTVAHAYALPVESVDRFVISSSNLLAWLTTANGPCIAKCCAMAQAHDWLSNVAELLVWLDRQHVPVAVPLPTRAGQRQVRCDHLTLGLQHVIPGQLLEPIHIDQAYAAGLVLAQVHAALAAYPRASDFIALSPVAALAAAVMQWVEHNRLRLRDPALDAAGGALVQQLRSRVLPVLPIQLVHGDYRAANILWHAGKIAAILDFEELRWGYRVNDLTWAAVHLGTQFRQWGPVSVEVHAAFFKGYGSIHPLSGAEREWLPALMAWHSMELAISASGGPMFATCVDAVTSYIH
jgi:homoserine kinase type II